MPMRPKKEACLGCPSHLHCLSFMLMIAWRTLLANLVLAAQSQEVFLVFSDCMSAALPSQFYGGGSLVTFATGFAPNPRAKVRVRFGV